ncbi:uncharacterized protein LOC123301359 [Chrysoperla carnea]|uniref:uncharacterized protein LOC123301359 n=1 Tax=Chrysoperla carnea TaxID=189513 RepID=UPI001D0922CB|nr:uncharacterized protein LOC123301359 [Chrysoperla carnea]
MIELQEQVTVSNAHTVTLLSVQRGISGVYKCEVSADAPYFHTDIRSAQMTVVEIPNGIPVVTVDRLRFAQGGPLIADCTAPPSSPATNLTWFVNDQRVPGSTAKSITKTRNSSLEIATSRLELSTADPTTHPQLGPIRLRCEATLFKIFKVTSIEVDIKPNSPPLLSASVLGHSNNHFSGEYEKENRLQIY